MFFIIKYGITTAVNLKNENLPAINHESEGNIQQVSPWDHKTGRIPSFLIPPLLRRLEPAESTGMTKLPSK